MKNLLVSAGVALLVVVLGFAFFGPAKEIVKLGALVSPDISSDYLCVGDACTAYRRGSCIDASSTVISILNPWVATATAVISNLYGTNGTNTILLAVGTSSAISNRPTALNNDGFLPYLNLITQTISTSSGFTLAGSGVNAEATSTNRTAITLGPTDYLLAIATGTAGSDFVSARQSLTNTNNTFSCTYSIEIKK